jgi:hypothetical protein
LEKSDKKITIFIIIFDIIIFLLLLNIETIIKFVNLHLVYDIIIALLIIMAFVVNTIILIVIKRKIPLLFFIDLFLIHTINIWIAFLVIGVRYNINNIRPYIFPIIVSIIYIFFSIKYSKKNKIKDKNK